MDKPTGDLNSVWVYNTSDPIAKEHEGWVDVVVVDEDREISSGAQDPELINTIGVAWRALCDCGWHSWTIVTLEYPSPDGWVIDESTRQVIVPMWEAHVREILTLSAIAAAKREVDRALVSLDRAVIAARRDGYSWAAIGEVVGITRQSAHERWSRIDQSSL